METIITKEEIGHIVEVWIRPALDKILKITEQPNATVKNVEGELYSTGADLAMVIDWLTHPEIFRD